MSKLFKEYSSVGLCISSTFYCFNYFVQPNQPSSIIYHTLETTLENISNALRGLIQATLHLSPIAVWPLTPLITYPSLLNIYLNYFSIILTVSQLLLSPLLHTFQCLLMSKCSLVFIHYPAPHLSLHTSSGSFHFLPKLQHTSILVGPKQASIASISSACQAFTFDIYWFFPSPCPEILQKQNASAFWIPLSVNGINFNEVA